MGNGNSRDLAKSLHTLFVNALHDCLEYWEKSQGKDGGAYRKVDTAFKGFCRLVSERQIDAYPIGSHFICNYLDTKYVPVSERPPGWRRERKPIEHWGVPREMRSVILTALARFQYEELDQGIPIRGRIVSHFGRVLNRTAGRCGKMYVEWFEDMGTGIPLVDAGPEPKEGYHDWLLAPQSTRMMRGILHAVRLKDGVMHDFWLRAAQSERFPERIFTDPGDFERRACFMASSQLLELALFLSHAPEPAVRRFGGAFAERVRTMQTVVYSRVNLPGGCIAEVGVCDPEENDPKRLFGNLGVDTSRICWESGEGYQSDVREHITLHVERRSRSGLLNSVLVLMQDRERAELARSIFFP